ncbi:glycosyltransferase family 4 protein [Sporomusa sp.]|uniref:glycosyltransferase family 4 protein n=1 Tax=Sporomusa sp. TaxID=2078658 RepID=UPI002D093B9C|nr:glycosyltransferase family 4 protein [Sporomusa sp.]HWR06365.1 glycosyltransferase family 4 protein [Sporomusa sp.]
MARICMILNNFEQPFGGPELQAQKVAALLMARGHGVFIIAKGSGKAPAHEVLDKLQIIRLNVSGLASLELFMQLFKYKNDYDVIHVHGVGRLASVAINFGKHFNKKVFIKVTTAGHVIKKPASRFKELMQKVLLFRERKLKLLQQANGVIAISSEIRQELENNGFSEKSIYDIPNGVDTSHFYPASQEEKVRLRNQLGLPVDKQIFIYTGKLTRRKGIDTLITAWCKSLAQEKGMLVMLGSGKGQGDSLETYIHTRIKAESLNHSVLTPGDVDNVADYLRAADVFVFPSRREGLPNSLIEAMACSLLCIASDIGGNKDLIIPGCNGFLLPVEDVDEWSRQINNASVAIDNNLSEAAVSLISDKYDLRITVNRLERLFTDTWLYN